MVLNQYKSYKIRVVYDATAKHNELQVERPLVRRSRFVKQFCFDSNTLPPWTVCCNKSHRENVPPSVPERGSRCTAIFVAGKSQQLHR